MPIVFRYEGYRFLFFANEGEPREPIHIHVRKAEKIAKFWLEPAVMLADAFGLTSTELNRLERIVIARREFFVEKWHEFFGD